MRGEFLTHIVDEITHGRSPGALIPQFSTEPLTCVSSTASSPSSLRSVDTEAHKRTGIFPVASSWASKVWPGRAPGPSGSSWALACLDAFTLYTSLINVLILNHRVRHVVFERKPLVRIGDVKGRIYFVLIGLARASRNIVPFSFSFSFFFSETLILEFSPGWITTH